MNIFYKSILGSLLTVVVGVAYAVDNCGGYNSVDNPNLCCTDDYDKNFKTSLPIESEGNCVWWTWHKGKEYYDVNLFSRSAKFWGSSATNSGYAVGYSPVSNTIAVRESGTYGHVAWVESVSATTIDVSEMNCKYKSTALGTTARNKTYALNFFSKYVLPSLKIKKIKIQDEQLIKADASAGPTSPNFHAKFVIENPSSKDQSIESIAIVLQKKNLSNNWIDQYDMYRECSGVPLSITNQVILANTDSAEFTGTASITELGSYKALVRAKVSGSWFEVGSGIDFIVENFVEYPGQHKHNCALGALVFNGEMGCVGNAANTTFTNLVADVSSANGLAVFTGKANTKNKASDTQFSATAYIDGNYDSTSGLISVDVKKIQISDRLHYRTDQCIGAWGATGLDVAQCDLTYDNGAGCKLWFRLKTAN